MTKNLECIINPIQCAAMYSLVVTLNIYIHIFAISSFNLEKEIEIGEKNPNTPNVYFILLLFYISLL